MEAVPLLRLELDLHVYHSDVEVLLGHLARRDELLRDEEGDLALAGLKYK